MLSPLGLTGPAELLLDHTNAYYEQAEGKRNRACVNSATCWQMESGTFAEFLSLALNDFGILEISSLFLLFQHVYFVNSDTSRIVHSWGFPEAKSTSKAIILANISWIVHLK